jgi:hypothetical protein
MTPEELHILAEASKLLTRTEYRKDAARLNAIITMEGGDTSTLCRQQDKEAAPTTEGVAEVRLSTGWLN